MADVLRVSDEGLQVLAAHCETVSAELVAATPLPRVGLPIQATSGAVGATHAAVGEVITVLAQRAQTSAVKSAMAGAEFAANDTAGAQQAAAIAASIPRV
ncbi:MAG: hypothetical protein VYA67_02520 [Actinomycetota bacterium]|uniref:PE family protein n=1 Tax=Mycobacterium lentiflavum TaxID=141349 RepID=A0ABY3V337_MYCLN|nr:hypothetical protein [Mycobacterium lentiflavum]MEE3062825.1 hypothetical protein [Actinomycetota bacterium]ULP43917.1 hypothetical protein MJO58_08245 [Mycobacterium lentiflavum]